MIYKQPVLVSLGLPLLRDLCVYELNTNTNISCGNLTLIRLDTKPAKNSKRVGENYSFPDTVDFKS